MSITVVNSLPEEDWRRFVEEHPMGNVFHSPEMFQVFRRAKRHEPELWAATSQGHILALLLPVHITLKDGLYGRLTTRSVAHGSVLCTPGSDGREALAQLLQSYARQASTKTLFTELRNLADLTAIKDVLVSCGFRYEDHLNYLIDLRRPPEEILRSISRSGRKAIYRSERRGVQPEEVNDRSLLPIYYGLLQRTYQRARVPLADISLFEAAFDILVPRGMAKMLLARVEDKYAAASLEVPYKGVIFSWYSGYDDAFRDYYANDGLVWHILQWGAHNHIRYFDFGGAGRPHQPYGPRDFKAKFGGQLVNYGRYTCVHAPVCTALGKGAYQAYRRLLWFRIALRRAPSTARGRPPMD